MIEISNEDPIMKYIDINNISYERILIILKYSNITLNISKEIIEKIWCILVYNYLSNPDFDIWDIYFITNESIANITIKWLLLKIDNNKIFNIIYLQKFIIHLYNISDNLECDKSCKIIMFAYVLRLINNKYIINYNDISKILLASFILTIKTHDDQYILNKDIIEYYGEGLTNKCINTSVNNLLKMLDYRVLLYQNEYRYIVKCILLSNNDFAEKILNTNLINKSAINIKCP